MSNKNSNFGTLSSLLKSLRSCHSASSTNIPHKPPDTSEVYPGLYVGDVWHYKIPPCILNAAEGKHCTQVDTGPQYYRDCPGINYKGLQLMSLPSTDISKYFHTAANFIDEGISSGGRVLVHCMAGTSRSATCAIAFLMIKRGMSFPEAVGTVRARRNVHPNDGFIHQLQQLERDLHLNKKETNISVNEK